MPLQKSSGVAILVSIQECGFFFLHITVHKISNSRKPITDWVLTGSNIFISTVHYLPFNPAAECQEVLSEPQGTDGLGKRYTFIINSPDEYVTAVDVRAGGWVDAIRLHTNYKSSIWMGGTGGEKYHLRPPPGRKILGIIGTSGKLVGSLGVLLSRLIHFKVSNIIRTAV